MTTDATINVSVSSHYLEPDYASGWVRCNSFNKNHGDFSQAHRKTFISVNRCPFSEDHR
jgi:hypothetical protein